MQFDFDIYATSLAMMTTLFVGKWLTKRIKFLRKYDIPEPVSGGVLIAILILLLTLSCDCSISFDDTMQEPLMLGFFTALGLSADLKSLKQAGNLLIVFLLTTVGLLIMQNVVGIGAMLLLDEHPLIGIIGGSVSLTGGFGTGAAWGALFEGAPYHFKAATTISVVAATFGVITAGFIGGPMANFYIRRYKLSTPGLPEEKPLETEQVEFIHAQPRLITVNSLIESSTLLIFSVFIGVTLSRWLQTAAFTLPTFVWCMFVGVILRNVLSHTKIYHVFDREMDVIGNFSLSLFLAFAIMNVNLLALVDLALPITIMLICQLILMFFYGWLVTFKLCGKNYNAAVLTAGQCGFAIGSTYNAIANMQSITLHHGPSQSAFIIVPIVGAFFIDIINAFIINLFILLPIY